MIAYLNQLQMCAVQHRVSATQHKFQTTLAQHALNSSQVLQHVARPVPHVHVSRQALQGPLVIPSQCGLGFGRFSFGRRVGDLGCHDDSRLALLADTFSVQATDDALHALANAGQFHLINA